MGFVSGWQKTRTLEALAKSKGKPVSDLEVQLEFLVSELGPSNFNSYYTNENNYQRFYAATDPETATSYFMWGWNVQRRRGISFFK